VQRTDDGKVVREAAEVKQDDELTVRLETDQITVHVS
jgi:ribosomal 50S subunit-recycling heat shock protein